MTRLSEILCIVVAIATASLYAIAYIGGRQGAPLSLGPFPAQLAPWLVTGICVASLIVMVGIALVNHRPARQPITVLALASLFVVIGFTYSQAQMFQTGFRLRITSTVSDNELRGIAQACHRVMPVGGFLPGPQKLSLWDESAHRKQWNEVAGSTALSKLDPWLTIHNDTDTVTISWGGALVGHWGLIIRTDTKTEADNNAAEIKTFVSPH